MVSNFKKFFLLFSTIQIFFYFSFLIAQNNSSKIVGYVYKNNSEPLTNVRVTLFNADTSINANEKGYFEFSNLGKGVYSILIEHIGFESLYIDNIRITNEIVVNLKKNILKEKIFYSDEIVISASRIEQPQSKSSSQLNVVTKESIIKRNAKSSAEALREESGIAIQKTNHGGGSAIIRGLSSNQILIMVDGVRLNNSTFRLGNHQYLTTIDNLMLDRVEVIRGPMSVLHGSDAMGGTINLVSDDTKVLDENRDIEYEFFGRYASADQERTIRGSLISKLKDFTFITGATFKKYSDLKRGSNSEYKQLEKSTNGSIQSPTGFSAYDFDAKIKYEFSKERIITLVYQRSRQFDVPRYDKYENNGYYLWQYKPQNRDLIYLKYRHKFEEIFIDNVNTTLSYQLQEEGREIQKEVQSNLSRENDRVGTFGFNATVNKKISYHNIISGIDLYADQVKSEREYLDTNTGITIKNSRGKLPNNAKYNTFGIFLRDEIKIDPNYIILAGIRYSYVNTNFRQGINFKKEFNSATGSIGFSYNISEKIKFKSNIGQAFRAPNLSDFSKLGESKGNIYEVPNLNLEPERLNSIDLGIHFDYPIFRLNMSVYYSHISGIIESADDIYNGKNTIEIEGNIYKIKSKQNIGNAFIRGIETQLKLNLYRNLLFYSNITSTYGHKISTDEPVGGIPPIFGILGLNWDGLNYYLQFNMRFALKQDRLSFDDIDDPRIPEGGTPAWKTVNFRSGYDLTKNISIQAAVENILDYNYREHGSGINASGRNFIFSLRISY